MESQLTLEILRKDWLSLAVAGAIVSTVGTLLGIFLKDLLFSRSLERFKQRQALNAVFQKYRDPLALATCELVSRLIEVLNDFPTVYLNQKVLNSKPTRQLRNSTDDEYFQRYKLISTLYRICSLLAWLELYRQELTFLHPDDDRKLKKLDRAAHRVRENFADGQLNESAYWARWDDKLVFREELRAIGESLIEARGSARSVMGYGKFCELLDSPEQNATKRWSGVMLNFMLGVGETKRDFRKFRLRRLLGHLVVLLKLLRPNLVEPYMLDAVKRHPYRKRRTNKLPTRLKKWWAPIAIKLRSTVVANIDVVIAHFKLNAKHSD